MKKTVKVQMAGLEQDVILLEKYAKESWKQSGYLVKDIKTLDLYIKLEEHTCYFVINDEYRGALPLVEDV